MGGETNHPTIEPHENLKDKPWFVSPLIVESLDGIQPRASDSGTRSKRQLVGLGCV